MNHSFSQCLVNDACNALLSAGYPSWRTEVKNDCLKKINFMRMKSPSLHLSIRVMWRCTLAKRLKWIYEYYEIRNLDNWIFMSEIDTFTTLVLLSGQEPGVTLGIGQVWLTMIKIIDCRVHKFYALREYIYIDNLRMLWMFRWSLLASTSCW